MTPRGTDWLLAAMIALLGVTGVLTLISGNMDDAWIFMLHGYAGFLLSIIIIVKLRRVWRRLLDPRRWDRRTGAGMFATFLVGLALGSGWVWSNGGDLFVAGWNLLNWHLALGMVLTLAVVVHAVLRAKPLRQRDLLHRRQFLQLTGGTLVAGVVWWLERPTAAALGWRGAERRWTGSYEQGSFGGNAFPTSSWVADHPRPLAVATYHLRVTGLVRTPLALPITMLVAGDQMEATLDCTGGFYSTQHWSGIKLARLLEIAQVTAAATHVRIISHTGYRWSFPLPEAHQLLLAIAVGDEPLSHAHGAPVRLVAPGHRGFQWIKWVEEIEVHAGLDYGAAASTIWSSWTQAGRGND